VFAIGSPELLTTPPRLAGLVIDAWTEVIPDSQTSTGIAVHFDSPSAKPPQTLLVSVPQGNWTAALALSLVRQTFGRAKMRAVSPDQIVGLGQYIPATFMSDAVDPGPEEDIA
jgi:hypothetical protein